MKNNLLLSVIAVLVAALALTSCEKPSNVTEVCTDMVKQSMHKSARSLAQLDGEVLSICEYEFLGGVNDNRLVYRTIAFGNGFDQPKKVDTLTYEYGEWGPANNSFSIYVTPPAGEPYTLWYEGNAFITPDDKKIGGEGMDVMARVEKWEKVIATLPNNKWEGTYSAEFVTDSVFRDSIKSIFVPPMSFKYDTIKVFDRLDTVSADTTCYYSIELKRDAQFANTGTFYKKSVRSTYDRATKQVNIISEAVTEYDCKWFFSEVSSDSKFTITLQNVNDEKQGEKMSISKYKTDEAGKALEFLLNGATFKHPELP
jgi:hypothetical protein